MRAPRQTRHALACGNERLLPLRLALIRTWYPCCRCRLGEDDFDYEYLECHRKAQLARLEGHGQAPKNEELEHLQWPHNLW